MVGWPGIFFWAVWRRWRWTLSFIAVLSALGFPVFLSCPTALGAPIQEGGHRPFIRGDSNGDGAISIADIFTTIRSFYIGNVAPPCADAADFDDSGEIDTTDVVTLLGFLFFYTKIPPAPFPEIGFDLTADSLDCVSGSRSSEEGLGGGGGKPGDIGQDVDFVNFGRSLIYGYPGEQSLRLPIYIRNYDEVEGLTLSVQTDPRLIWLKRIEFEGSSLSEIHPEMVMQYNQRIQEGYLATSILIDAAPPFEGRVIYPQAMPRPIANLVFSISPQASVNERVAIYFKTAPGSDALRPGLANEFSIRGISERPLVDPRGVTVEIAAKEDLFIRGDADGDWSLGITDAIAVLRFKFLGESQRCEDSADIDDDGDISMTDVVGLLLYLFSGGAPPAEPFPLPGKDPTPDPLPECSAAN